MKPPGDQPDLKHLVLVGGGHAQVSVLKGLAMRPIPGLRITLVSRDIMTPYSGMLPGYLEGLYRQDEITIDLSHLARFAGARFIAAEVTGIDPARKTLTIDGRPPMTYDVLSMNIGSNTDLDSIKGAAKHAIPVKPISTLLGRLDPVINDHSRHMAIIGGGAAGVECALALRQRHPDSDITLVQRGRRLSPEYPAAASRRLLAELKRHSITVHMGRAVTRIGTRGLTLEDGTTIGTDLPLMITAGAPPAWLKKTGLPLDDRGFIRVDETLRIEGLDDHFAAGDIASLTGRQRPKAGVFAVRAGRHLEANIRRKLLGRGLRPWKPQRHYLALIGTGGGEALAIRGGACLPMGRLGWLWKEFIDRRFMDKFSELPEMAAPPPSALAAPAVEHEDPVHAAMRCLGCGSKLGFDVLDQAMGVAADHLRQLHPKAPSAPSIIGDSSRTRIGNRTMVQSVDALSAIIDDPFLLGRIAALHALSDLYASHARPLEAQALVTLPAAAARLQREDATQILAGAMAALAEDGARLSGGHTTEGAAMQVGFAVTGEAAAGKGEQPVRGGESLVLTKPLGIGVIMAAHAAGSRLADGDCRDRAIAVMAQSNKDAAALATRHGKFAMTDVTGFGLARHAMSLLERQEKSLSVEFDPAAAPMIDGTERLIQAGFRSSLAAMNRKAAPFQDDAMFVDPIYHDPQTGGGLLVAVPRRHLASLLGAAERKGLSFTVVGGVVNDGLGQLRLKA